jgi:hypothetical protein
VTEHHQQAYASSLMRASSKRGLQEGVIFVCGFIWPNKGNPE